MTTVKDIYAAIDRLAPFDTQLGFDNAGFLIGSGDTQVTKVLVALDVTAEVIKEAEAGGCELIVSHHPIIFKPIKSLDGSSIPYLAARCGLSVISAHTNLDGAFGGVNDCLAEVLVLTDRKHLESAELGTAGTLPSPMTARELAIYIKEKLGCGGVQYTESSGKISRLAVIGGSAGDLAMPVFAAGEADAVLTGEAKHHELLDAVHCGKSLLVAGHFDTEAVVLKPLADYLAAQFAGIEFTVSKAGAPSVFV